MKLKKLIAPALIGSSLFTLSCGEKEKAAASAAAEDAQTAVESTVEDVAEKAAKATAPAAEAVTKIVEAVKAPAATASADELATKLGVAGLLPASTEGLLAIHKLGDSVDRLLKTDLGKLILEIAKENGEDIEAEMQTQPAQMVRGALGEEVFFTFGAGAGEQLANLIEVSRISNYINGYSATQFVSMMTDDAESLGNPASGMAKALAKDPEKILSLLERAELPPVTVGIKVSDQEMRDGFAAMIAGQFAQLLTEEGAPIEELKAEKDGVKLTGFTVLGKKIADEIGERERKNFEEVLGSPENVEKAIQAFSEKNIVVATGVKGERIFLYAGASLDGFSLVEKASDSILAQEGTKFLGAYKDKDIRLLSYSPKEALQPMTKNLEGFASLVLGLRDGLANVEALGDTRDVQRLLTQVAKLDKELFSMQKYDRHGWVGFIEDGFKIEAHGGSNQPSIDFSVDHKFASFGDLDGVAVFMNSAGDKAFGDKASELINAAGEAAYLLTKRAADLDIEGADFRNFKQGFALVDGMLKPELLEIWKSLSLDLGEGLGNEGAFVVDLKGTMPTVPMVPAPIVKEGKVPRIAWASTVKDRSKVSASWDRMNGALTKALEKAGQLGMNFPMQVPFSSENNGLKSHFFTSIPFTTQDAMPSVSVNDDFWFLSTSPKLSGELMKAAKSGKASRKGAYFRINFQAIQEATKDWLELVKNNQDEIFKDDKYAKEDFVENLPMIMRVLGAANELQDFTIHARKEGGENRGSIHFKMK